MCKIKGKKIKSKFLPFSCLVLCDFVYITKSIGTMQNFGINDKPPSQLRVKGWVKEMEVGREIQ